MRLTQPVNRDRHLEPILDYDWMAVRVKFSISSFVCTALLFSSGVQAERETFPPRSAPITFIGVLDLEARYGGFDEWVRAAWGSNDPELEFELSDGRPFEGAKTRLKASQFTMLETGYEYPSILVYGRLDEPRVNDWVRVFIDGASKWIRLRPEDRFRKYSELFDSGRLAYLTRKTINIATTPGGQTVARTLKSVEQGANPDGPWDAHVQVNGRAEIVIFNDDGARSREDWLKVRIGSEQPCEGAQTPAPPLAEGWIRAHHQDDQSVAVWFYSRGC